VSTLFRLALPAQFVEEMFAQARAELPNECCGLLAGTIGPDGVGRVVRRYPLKNAAACPVEYLSDPLDLFVLYSYIFFSLRARVEYLSDPMDMFAAERDRRQRGIEFLAVYHSHPISDPLPSKTDRERNYSTDVVNLIISLKDGKPTMRGWWLTVDGETEAFLEKEAEQP
jgi:proteasome lid subunit RPN8/RPN11